MKNFAITIYDFIITGYKKKCKYPGKNGVCKNKNGDDLEEDDLDKRKYIF